MRRTILTIFVLGAMVGFLPAASAQQETEAGPALGVARISLTNGDVSTKRGDSGDWVAATVNAPVVEGDTVATGSGSRAEIQMDYSNLVRLDAETEVVMANLGERNFRVQVFNGRVTYSELRGGEADVDIETPHAAIRPHKNGRYEIETRAGETVIQVRKGQAEVFTSEGTETVNQGRMLVVRDSPEGIQVRLASDEPRGDWDRWNEDRDERLSDVESYRYVSRSVVGAGDLDGYGDWRYVSGYGYCWYPRVAVGWAPYRHGHWGWAPYYGWTWIGYEPWGWAPYHYGRWWNHPSYGWGWYPGDRHYYQPWRPALVGFFGYGGRGGWSVGVGFGSVGWVPLAPGEIYYPWYGRRGYGGRNSTIIVDNSVNIYNDYRNARVSNGVTVVDARGFSRGRLDNVRSLNRNELARASAVRGNVPVVPERQAQGSILRNIRTSASSAQPGSARRATFSRNNNVRQAASPRRPSFDEQRRQMAASVRQIRTQDAATSSRGNAAARQSATRSAPRANGSVRSAGEARSSRRTEAATRSGVVSPRNSPTYSAPDRRTSDRLDRGNNGVDRGAGVRGSRSGTSATPRGDARTRSSGRGTQLQPRDNNIDRGGVRSGLRDTTVAPPRSGTRSVDRGSIQRRNNSMDNGPSMRDSRSSRAPSRTESRVDRGSSRFDGGSSRVRGSDYSSGRGRIPRATAPSSSGRSRAPEIRSTDRSPHISRRSGSSSPRMSGPSRSSRPAPRASSPSPRMSSPRMSGGGGRGGSGGGIRGGSGGSRGPRR